MVFHLGNHADNQLCAILRLLHFCAFRMEREFLSKLSSWQIISPSSCFPYGHASHFSHMTILTDQHSNPFITFSILFTPYHLAGIFCIPSRFQKIEYKWDIILYCHSILSWAAYQKWFQNNERGGENTKLDRLVFLYDTNCSSERSWFFLNFPQHKRHLFFWRLQIPATIVF